MMSWTLQVPQRARPRTYTARYKRDLLVEHEASDRARSDCLPSGDGQCPDACAKRLLGGGVERCGQRLRSTGFALKR